MTPQSRPRFGKGVRLHHDRDGSVMLLVPEGALVLNPSAAATLELVDGRRSIDEITSAIVDRFEVERGQAGDDVRQLLERLVERRLLEA
ncbi:MAG: pyrroloquinoline quinone biosynthesis peptide chaperone PqqD [Candidatus Eremiobacteraeota bacterium]|nr:pyrroloquinoline quinone biosynthesis peptide chaperone PqqD [Candidatus Eremiobacteraeota bacterium]